MTTERMMMTLPFSGFYESAYSRELDAVEEREAENMAEDEPEKYPDAICLDASEIGEAFYWVTDYSQAHRELARDYVTAFNEVSDGLFGLKLGLEYESLSSPRYYNFETDRIFTYIPRWKVSELFALSAWRGHMDLAEYLREHFTSRSGFHSYYSNDLDDWLEKDLDDWDHNELCALLCAVLLPRNAEANLSGALFEYMMESGDFDAAFDAAVDWDKLATRLEAKRDAKRPLLPEDDPEYVAPVEPRFPFTLDLFA